jgi:hypothetical protein
MKESVWGYLILLFGIFIIVIMMVIRDYQTTNDEEYYILKEVTQAAMIDAVDYSYYREYNDLRIVEEKFVENFLRRFAESMSNSKNYKIEIFEVSENPPKVSVRVSSKTGEYKVDESEGAVDFGVVNILSSILDMKYDITPNEDRKDGTEDGYGYYSKKYYTVAYSGVPTSFPKTTTYTIKLNELPNGVSASDVESCSISYAKVITSTTDMDSYLAAKAKAEMEMVSGDDAYGISGLTSSYILEHALKPSNFTISATCEVKSNIVYINVTTKTNNVNGVDLIDKIRLNNGSYIYNVYFVPATFTPTFKYTEE